MKCPNDHEVKGSGFVDLLGGPDFKVYHCRVCDMVKLGQAEWREIEKEVLGVAEGS